MALPGLDRRLQQHARRSGVAVGLSMAATMVLGFAAFVWLFFQMDGVMGDFTGGAQWSAPAPTKRPQAVAGVSEDAEEDKPTARPTRRPTEAPTPAPTATPTPEVFRATHLSNPNVAVNLRPAPGTNNAPVAVLPPSTPIQFMNEQQTGPDGLQWLRFRTADGIEGWLREGTFIAL